jgi:hypothetical protein
VVKLQANCAGFLLIHHPMAYLKFLTSPLNIHLACFNIMRSHYLDAWEESGSTTIFQELGVQFIAIESIEKGGKEYSEDFSKEHSSEKEVHLHGPLTFDVRDTGDNWLRCYLDSKEGVVIPAALYRRLHGVKTSKYQPVHRHALLKDEDTHVVAHSYRELVCDLCKQFFEQGWVTGTISYQRVKSIRCLH